MRKSAAQAKCRAFTVARAALVLIGLLAAAPCVAQDLVGGDPRRAFTSSLLDRSERVARRGMDLAAVEAANRIPPHLRYPTSEEADRFAAIVSEAATLDVELRGWAAPRGHPDALAEAAALRREAVVLVEATFGPDHPRTAVELIDLALILQFQGRYEEAAPLFGRAMANWESGLGSNHPFLGSIIENYAACLEMLGRFEAGERVLRRAIALEGVRDEGAFTFTWTTIGHLAANLDAQQRYLEAESFHRRALWGVEQEQSFDGLPVDLVNNLTNLASNLSAQGRYDDAEALLSRALAIEQQGGGQASSTTSSHMAANMARQGRLPEAEALLARVLARRDAQNRPAAEIAQVLANRAAVLDAQGRFREAQPLHRRVLAMRGDASLAHPDTASAMISLARNLLAQELQPADEARDLLARALAIRSTRLGGRHPETSQVHVLLGFAALGEGNPEEALTHARAAQAGAVIAEPWLSGLRGPGQDGHAASSAGVARLLLSRAAFEAREMSSELAVSAPPDEAFMAAQEVDRSQAALGLAMSAAQSALVDAGLGQLAVAWRDALERVAALDRAITESALRAQSVDERLHAQLALERSRADDERRAREAELAARFPLFFDLAANPPLAVGEVQRLLGADEALVLITPGDEALPEGHRRGLVFAITREQPAWAEVSLEPTVLRAEVAALQAVLQGGGATRAPGTGGATIVSGGARGFDRSRAHRLYQALFGAPQIARTISGKDRWTIVTQGVLLSAPFAALVMDEPQGDDAEPSALRTTHWLGLERTLSIAPSVSALRAQRREAPARTQARQVTFFGLGDPAFDGRPGPAGRLEMRGFFRDRSANIEALRALPRLPGARTEIERLAQAFGANRSDYVLGVAATETELNRRNREGSLSGADVITFATHGLMAGDLAGSLAEPALALTPPAAPSEHDDGLLTASEAARLRLNARWVILSACNTAAGGTPHAEGLSGLARAFFYAGARTLLVSQWPVNDEAAQRLTTRAVELQRAGNISAAEAMRRSMATLTGDASRDAQGRSFAHPSTWAPFVLVSGE